MTFYLPQLSIYNNLHKRLQNVKSPQKRRGPTPERGQPKKRIDFSSSDNGEDNDADSCGGSTVILHETSGSSSDDGHTACKLIATRLGNIMIVYDILHYRYLYFTFLTGS